MLKIPNVSDVKVLPYGNLTVHFNTAVYKSPSLMPLYHAKNYSLIELSPLPYKLPHPITFILAICLC